MAQRVTVTRGQIDQSPPKNSDWWEVDLPHPLTGHDDFFMHVNEWGNVSGPGLNRGERWSDEEGDLWAEALTPKGWRFASSIQVTMPENPADAMTHGRVREGATMIRLLRTRYLRNRPERDIDMARKRSRWRADQDPSSAPSSRRKLHRISETRELRPRSAAPRGTERPIGGGFILAVYSYPFGRRPVAWHVYHRRNPNEWYAAGEADSFDDAIDTADRKFGVNLRAFARDPRRRPRPIVITPRQRAYISKKIPILIAEGYPQKQSIAIAFRMAGVPRRVS